MKEGIQEWERKGGGPDECLRANLHFCPPRSTTTLRFGTEAFATHPLGGDGGWLNLGVVTPCVALATTNA